MSPRARTGGEGSGRKRKLPKIITPDEAKALLAAPNVKAPTGLRNRCMLELMYRAGLRVGEVVAVTPRDVDLDEGSIRIHDGKTGDGTAYFPVEDVTPWLEQWLTVRRRLQAKSTAPLFCTLKGTPVSTRYMQQMLYRMKTRAGIRARCTPHTLRHTFATEALRDGFTIYEVKELLRHGDISTTEIYLHLENEQLKNRIQRRRR